MYTHYRAETRTERERSLYMIALRVQDKVGVLYSCIKVFAEEGINLFSVHVFPVQKPGKREANIIIFAEKITPEVVERLKRFDFVLDLKTYRVSPRGTSRDMLIMPVSIIQESMKFIFEEYGESIFASLFFRIGYIYGLMIAREYSEFRQTSDRPTTNIDRLFCVLSVLKALNFITGFMLSNRGSTIELCLNEPVELRLYESENSLPCYYSRGIVQGLCDYLFQNAKIINMQVDKKRKICCFHIVLK